MGHGHRLLKLKEDGSNWSFYKDRTLVHLCERGLYRHLRGTARKPITIVQHKGGFYKPDDLHFLESPLSDTESEELEAKSEEYAQKEALGIAILSSTLPESVWLEVRHEPTLAAKWDKAVSICEKRGAAWQAALLTRLERIRYIEGSSIHAHIAAMIELKDTLSTNSCLISDDEFVRLIRESFSHIVDYGLLITSLKFGMELRGERLDSATLISSLYREADARTFWSGPSTGLVLQKSGSHRYGMKRKEGTKGKSQEMCSNCRPNGHSKERKEKADDAALDKKKEPKKKEMEALNVTETKRANGWWRKKGSKPPAWRTNLFATWGWKTVTSHSRKSVSSL